ncbi:MAG: hypothetical protein A4E60_00462 [Syntrophorhabdus sp. PtaB.Bin047]|nr:MAG: hypothetical protein A4E60_00462 [Syntrophorhabdus sp. PtaB.Bin047]
MCTLLLALNIAGWLKGNDVPLPSRAILVLSGPPTRSFYAADLYRQGFAGEVYVTRPVREPFARMLDEAGIPYPRTEQLHVAVLLKMGVPATRIHVVGEPCLSTADEAEVARHIFSGRDCSILVVTSPYHVRRSVMIFGDVMKGCRFTVLGTPYESFPGKWWKDQDAARNVLLEVSKIIFYRLGGRFGAENDRGGTRERDG